MCITASFGTKNTSKTVKKQLQRTSSEKKDVTGMPEFTFTLLKRQGLNFRMEGNSQTKAEVCVHRRRGTDNSSKHMVVQMPTCRAFGSFKCSVLLLLLRLDEAKTSRFPMIVER